MTAIDRAAVARVLDQIASHLELASENPFKVRAFRTAARTVSSLAGDPADWMADGTLDAARGIGAAIMGVIRELIATGRSSYLDELREHTPPGLLEMLRISGLGVNKVRQIHQGLGIETIPELEGAARDGRLASLPGFGARTADNVLKGIAQIRKLSTFRLAHHAAEEAELLRAGLERVPGVSRALIAGDVRRRLELVRDLAVVLVADAPAADVLKSISQVAGIDEFGGQDERRAMIRFAGGESAQVVVTPAANLGVVWIQATGSAAHLARLGGIATERGFALSGAALWRGSEFVPTPDEETVYRALGIDWVPPELREDDDPTLPIPPLVTRADLLGVLHCHTLFTDGSLSVADLAAASREAGYRYLGITDHGGLAGSAGGLTEDELRRQWTEIAGVNRAWPDFRVLKGIEADIQADGSIGYPDSVLAGFDFVIASIHTRFAMDERAMTNRILTAIESPFVTILGHLTGRLLLSRDPYPLDLERVYRAAADHGVAIEINADPQRLDLDWREVRRARAAGVPISIGADAHSAAGLANVDWGVSMARKARLGPADLLNAQPVDEFLAFARRRRTAGDGARAR
jgi:DNA polymerase (family 10)